MGVETLLVIEDRYDFNSELFLFLLDKEPDLTPLQQRVYTCNWIISQFDNGGLMGMLYNADNRESWCQEVSGYCTEFGADRSSLVFQELAPIFSLPETGGTWGEYLERADPGKKLDKLRDYDPNDDLFQAVVTFSNANRRELVLGELA